MSWKDKLAEWWEGKQSGLEERSESEQRGKVKPTKRTKRENKGTGPQRAKTQTPSGRQSSRQQPATDASTHTALNILAFQDEHRTQLSGNTERSPRQQLIIGLDFGTNFSKVVLGETRIHYTVPMQDRTDGVEKYTVPVRLVVDETGCCRVGDAEQSEQAFDDLKIQFLRGNTSFENQTRMVAYLALILRHCRGWLFTEKSEIYRNTALEWFINIGLPTSSALSSELQQIYHAVTLAAWRLSGRFGEITIEKAEDALTLPEPIEIIERDVDTWAPLVPDAIRAFPEFSAQVSSYVQSPRKSTDLHALIDIGGGTIDVTLFNVVVDQEEEAHRYPILARNVVPLGTRFLIEERLRMLSPDSLVVFSPHEPVPSNEDMISTLGVTFADLAKADQDFKNRVQSAWSEEFRYTKTMRYGESRAWQDGLPVFVSGGGAACEFYQEALVDLFPPKYPWATRMEQLPVPEDLEAPGIDNENFGRLAVAYGLSFDADDIGEIIRPEEIEDLRQVSDVGKRYRDSHSVTKDVT